MSIDAENAKKDLVYFGRINFRGKNRLFGIKRRDRRQHMYVIGKTGTGKTALLHNMIVQDVYNNEGMCVVDPHGELVQEILSRIPEERMDDVIYFNPADSEHHIGFNVLELPDSKQKHLAASGLMSIFTKIWSNVWSARMEYILNNAILALLDTPGSTLLGIPRILVDKEYRQKIIENVKDPVVKAFWINEYEEWRDQFRNEAIAPIQNKVGQFLSTSIIRNIVGQSKSTIDIFNIMNDGKILLVDLSKGKLGEDNSSLLGGMLITKIQLAAMERVKIPEEERVDFYLCVDEFQNFATDSFAGILSEARKYRLNLIVAHQYVGQLITDISTRVRDSIFGNVGTMIIFRCGAADAEFLEKELEPEFTIQDIVNLPNYNIYLKLLVDGVSSRPFSAVTLPPFKGGEFSLKKEQIIEASRKHYARPRYVIEDEIMKWSGMTSGMQAKSFLQKGSESYDANCDNCKNKAQVPFKPIPGRPIYCKECLAKVKSGEINPIANSSRPNFSNKTYYSELSSLGINPGGEEFEKKEISGGRKKTTPRQSEKKKKEELNQEKRQPSIMRDKEFQIESSESNEELGLEYLKSIPDKTRKRQTREKEGNVQTLKEELKKALEGLEK